MTSALKMSAGDRSSPLAFITLKIRCALSSVGVQTTTRKVRLPIMVISAWRRSALHLARVACSDLVFATIDFWASVPHESGLSPSRPVIAPEFCTCFRKNSASFTRNASRGFAGRPRIGLPFSTTMSSSAPRSTASSVRSRSTASRIVRVVRRCWPSITMASTEPLALTSTTEPRK